MAVVLGHLGLNVANLEESKAYYDQLLPALGYETFFANDNEFSYFPSDGKRGTYLFFNRALEPGAHSRHQPGLQHLAFMMPTRAAVDAAFVLAGALGSQPVHAPRMFPEYSPYYYAAFWEDLNGFYLEAVCHRDE
jgi:catechol-2,3-dioxygenase